MVDGSARCWFLGSAVESGNIDGSCNNGSNGKRRKAASINHREPKIEMEKDNELNKTRGHFQRSKLYRKEIDCCSDVWMK